MQLPLRIAILECDTPLSATKAKYGSYGGCFKALLESGAQASGKPTPRLKVSYFDVVTLQKYPRLEDVDGILITGSRFNAFDSDPWIVKLVEFTRSVLVTQDRVRVIGVCFGHQIVGRALSAPVGRSEKGWEASVLPVRMSGIGEEVFGKEEISLFQMHRDVILRYPTMEVSGEKIQSLGVSDKCDTQGMYVKNRFITVQGHPEFTEEIVSEILESRHGQGVFDDETFEEMMSRVGKRHDGVRVAVAFWKFLLDD